MLHLCPGCDPELFPWLLGLKSQVELMPLGLANSHPLVLWHYPVVDGSLEESMLLGNEQVALKKLKRMGATTGDLGLMWRRRFRILRKKSY